MMYVVKRYRGRRDVPKNLRRKFATYNEARSAVRKWLRSLIEKGKAERDHIDLLNRTVSIGFYGFSVGQE